MSDGVPRWWRLPAGVLASGAFLWLASRGVSWPDVAAGLRSARYGPVVLALGLVVAGTALRAWCWGVSLAAAGAPVAFVRAWRILIIGQFLNIGIPARAGDVARVYLMGQAGPLSKVGVATSLVVEKLFHAIAFLVLLVPISLLVDLPPTLADARQGIVAVAFAPLLALFLLAWRGETVLAWLSENVRGDDPRRWGRRLARHGESVLRGLAVVRRARALIVLQAGYLGVWLSLAVVNYLVLQALGVAAPPVAALLVLVVSQMGTAVPSTPGKIGVYQLLCVLALTPFGVPRDQALTYGVMLQAVEYGPAVALGAFWLWSGAADTPHETGR